MTARERLTLVSRNNFFYLVVVPAAEENQKLRA